MNYDEIIVKIYMDKGLGRSIPKMFENISDKDLTSYVTDLRDRQDKQEMDNIRQEQALSLEGITTLEELIKVSSDLLLKGFNGEIPISIMEVRQEEIAKLSEKIKKDISEKIKENMGVDS